MEIREFVRDVLIDIIEGIKEAQKQPGVGGYIAPDGMGSHALFRLRLASIMKGELFRQP